MSHWSICRIRIKNPSLDLLKKVVEALAKELGGQVVYEIEDYYGHRRSDFLIGVKTYQIPRGIGVKVNEAGEVELVGDFYMVRREVEEFQRRLTQSYIASATAIALKHLGYQTQTQRVGNKVFIKAVAW